MGLPILIFCASAALSLAGCAAAMPGYVPDHGRNKIAAAAAKASAESSGTFAPDGRYVPTKTERDYTCRRLKGVMQLKIQQVRDAEANPPSGLIASLSSKTTPRHTSAGGPGSAYSEDRARLIALNELMAEKNCGRFDLDAALKAGNTETPEPAGAPAKSGRKKRSG
jgi:hypothetical protein